jgi:uncharacterized protein (DUF1330 family)
VSKGYWIVGVDVTDPKTYKSYLNANAEVFAKYGARFLVRGGRRQMIEGCGRLLFFSRISGGKNH